jgi:hypothetical protein
MSAAYTGVLVVGFDDETHASCDLAFEITNPKLNQSFVECILYCAYAMRHLANVSPRVGASLATTMKATTPATLNFGDTVCVEPGPTPAPRSFDAYLDVISDSTAYFKLKTHGFGVRGKGLEYFGPESVGVVGEYIAGRFHSPFERVISHAAHQCGEAYLSGRVRPTSDVRLAKDLAMKAFELAQS